MIDSCYSQNIEECFKGYSWQQNIFQIDNLYKKEVRSTFLYEPICWTTMKSNIQKMVEKMRMLRNIWEHTLKFTIKKDTIQKMVMQSL